MDKVWIVGEYKSGDFPGVAWDFCGVFSTKEKAIAACRNKNYFIAPFIIDDASFPDETVEMSDVEYPLLAVVTDDNGSN